MNYFLLVKPLLVSLFISVALLFSITSSSQVTRQWVRFFDDMPNSWNQARAVVTDDAGNAYVTGECSGNNNWDIVTIKYNASGAQEWVARYDGFHGIDYPTAIAIDKAGNIYVSGGSEGNGTLEDVITIKYNNAGVEQWIARYNGPDNSAEHGFGQYGVKVGNNGNVYVLGMASAKNGTEDYVSIKYNSQGVQQWVQYYNGPGDGPDWPFAMALDPVTEDVYVTGFTSVVNSVDWDYATIKYNSAGVVQWVRKYHESGMDAARAIGLDTQGNVYVTGNSASLNASSCVTIKYDASGTQKWTAHYTGPVTAGCTPTALDVDRSGNVYVIGTLINQLASFTVKYSSEGVQQWAQLQGGTSISAEGRALALDDEGNVYVTGYTDSSSAHLNRDYTTVKYSPEGVQQWIERYDATGSNDDPVDISVNKFHDVLVTGTAGRSVNTDHTNYHYLTVKYIQLKPLIVTATPDTTVYYGYGSNCVQLKADVSGGVAPYTFSWLAGGTTSTNSSTMVCPTSTTVYRVVVSDALGTTDTAQLSIKVIDVKCGSKVVVCHNGKELCIAASAVPAHLQHGDKLGNCSSSTSTNINDGDKAKDVVDQKGESSFIFKAYPNPFTQVSTIVYQLSVDAQVSITLIDIYGKERMTIVQGRKRAGNYVASIDAKKLAAGTYLCRMVISSAPDEWIHTLKLIVVK